MNSQLNDFIVSKRPLFSVFACDKDYFIITIYVKMMLSDWFRGIICKQFFCTQKKSLTNYFYQDIFVHNISSLYFFVIVSNFLGQYFFSKSVYYTFVPFKSFLEQQNFIFIKIFSSIISTLCFLL